MELIDSFTVDHLKLLPGIYVSRKDRIGNTVATTFDIRFTAPNREPVMDNPGLHTIEHLGATWLRNSGIKDRVIYFGPMGCRTGFYLILAGDSHPDEVYPVVRQMLEFIVGFEGEIPGATAAQCGNYLDQNLPMAKYYARKFLGELAHRRFNYPE